MVMDDYQRGFRDGWVTAFQQYERWDTEGPGPSGSWSGPDFDVTSKKAARKEKKRKLSKWQKFVKAKSKLPRFKYKTGKRKGMVNMKAVAAAWKKVPKSKK